MSDKASLKNLLKSYQDIVKDPKKFKKDFVPFVVGLFRIKDKKNASVKQLYSKTDSLYEKVKPTCSQNEYILLWSYMLHLHCTFDNLEKSDIYMEKIDQYARVNGLPIYKTGESSLHFDFVLSLDEYAMLQSKFEHGQSYKEDILAKIDYLLDLVDVKGQ